jgi:hypothetical protein
MRFADGVVEKFTSSIGLFSCPFVSVRGQSALTSTSNFCLLLPTLQLRNSVTFLFPNPHFRSTINKRHETNFPDRIHPGRGMSYAGPAQQPKGPLSKPSSPLQTKVPDLAAKDESGQRALAPQWPLLPSEFTAKKDKAPDDETQARALATEGVALMRAEKFEEALAKFRQAEKLLPREYSIEMNIGNCLMQLDRAGDAVSAFEKAAAIRPDSPAAHAMICSSRAESGDRSGAIRRVSPGGKTQRRSAGVQGPIK